MFTASLFLNKYEYPAIVDGENYNVEIKIKKTPVENKFYIHNMTLQNKKRDSRTERKG